MSQIINARPDLNCGLEEHEVSDHVSFWHSHIIHTRKGEECLLLEVASGQQDLRVEHWCHGARSCKHHFRVFLLSLGMGVKLIPRSGYWVDLILTDSRIVIQLQ